MFNFLLYNRKFLVSSDLLGFNFPFSSPCSMCYPPPILWYNIRVPRGQFLSKCTINNFANVVHFFKDGYQFLYAVLVHMTLSRISRNIEEIVTYNPISSRLERKSVPKPTKRFRSQSLQDFL